VTVEIDFDLKVDLEIYVLGRWPVTLIDAISEKKTEVFNKLANNPLEPGMLIATHVFEVEGERFLVTFGASEQNRTNHYFRVMHVERLKKWHSSGKRWP
jgi:hypothetical protein